MKHFWSLFLTFKQARFFAISSGILNHELPPCIGWNFFMNTLKFKIDFIDHPLSLSWNSSIFRSMTCCTFTLNHSFKFVEANMGELLVLKYFTSSFNSSALIAVKSPDRVTSTLTELSSSRAFATCSSKIDRASSRKDVTSMCPKFVITPDLMHRWNADLDSLQTTDGCFCCSWGVVSLEVTFSTIGSSSSIDSWSSSPPRCSSWRSISLTSPLSRWLCEIARSCWSNFKISSSGAGVQISPSCLTSRSCNCCSICKSSSSRPGLPPCCWCCSWHWIVSRRFKHVWQTLLRWWSRSLDSISSSANLILSEVRFNHLTKSSSSATGRALQRWFTTSLRCPILSMMMRCSLDVSEFRKWFSAVSIFVL